MGNSPEYNSQMPERPYPPDPGITKVIIAFAVMGAVLLVIFLIANPPG